MCYYKGSNLIFVNWKLQCLTNIIKIQKESSFYKMCNYLPYLRHRLLDYWANFWTCLNKITIATAIALLNLN